MPAYQQASLSLFYYKTTGMKHVLLFTLLLFAQMQFSQTPPEPTLVKFVPPTIVNARFLADYPNVKPDWRQDGEVYCAEYRVEESNMGRIVRYDKNGNKLSVENELHNDAYPVSIATYYVKTYPRERYAVWSYEDSKSNKTYYATRGEEKVWFDKNGKRLSAATIKNKAVLNNKEQE